MERAKWLQETRMRRFEEALGSWTEKRLTQEEAAMLLGVCPRTFRRYVDRYHEDGVDGLVDKRMGQVSSRRAPADEVLRLEALYRETCAGWSVAHFHDWYREKHGGERSYTWVKSRLQEAGLVGRGVYTISRPTTESRSTALAATRIGVPASRQVLAHLLLQPRTFPN